jgi:hypothetical protein
MTNEPTVTITLKEYEDLRKFKDNFLKSFIATIPENDFHDEIDFHFYSNDEMNKVLIQKIEKEKEKLDKFCKFFEMMKSFNVFDFIKFKKGLKNGKL